MISEFRFSWRGLHPQIELVDLTHSPVVDVFSRTRIGPPYSTYHCRLRRAALQY